MTEKNLDRILTALIVLVVLLLMASCAPYHLRRAEHHIKKAIEKGASVNRDTLWKDIKFVAPKMEFTTKLDKLVFKDTIVLKDQRGREAKLKVDTVTNIVYIECPPQEVEEKAPVLVNTEIKAGKSFWGYAPWFVIVFAVGVVAGFFVRLLILGR